MTGAIVRRTLPVAVAVLLLALPALLQACPFCSMQGETLTSRVNQASMVLYGTPTNAQPGAGGDSDGTTDLQIESVVKDNDFLRGKKVLTLNRFIPTDKDSKYKLVVFCDVFKGKVDPYSGMVVKADSDIAKYLKGALEMKDEKDPTKKLRFFFDYLDNADVEINNDAYKEFAQADYKEMKDLAKKLPAEKIAKWLNDPATPAFKLGLYASMLGHCGGDAEAKLLRELLDDPTRNTNSGIDGVLAGYTMLKPKEGWQYVNAILADAKKDFLIRYAALRAARFFWDYRPDLVDHKTIAAGVARLLDDKNMADLAIEDLRKWHQSQYAGKIIAGWKNEDYDIPIIRRAIVRFALSCAQEPDIDNVTAASLKAFVAERRQKDSQMVADIEELLKLETTSSATSAPAAPSKPISK
jgi:hypothetical protein